MSHPIQPWPLGKEMEIKKRPKVALLNSDRLGRMEVMEKKRRKR